MASKILKDDVKKGMTCLVLDPETKELEPAVVCKVPKHRRWVHAYLEIAHRKLKKVPIGELYKRPEDFEYEENIGQIPLFEANVSDDDPVDSNIVPDVGTEKGGKPTDEATSAISSSSTTVALKKGDLCLVQHEDDQWQPGVIVKVPKHGRWFHIYLELQHRRLKRIPADKIKPRPIDYEYSAVVDIDNQDAPGVQDLQDVPILTSDEDLKQEHITPRKTSNLSIPNSVDASLPSLRQCVARALLVAYNLWKQEVLSDDEYHCFKILTLQHDPTILASSFAAEENSNETVVELAVQSPRRVKKMSSLQV